MSEISSSYTFVWSVENFSLYSQPYSTCILSPVFFVDILDGSKFYLSLYPRGKAEEDFVHCDFSRCEDNGPEVAIFEVTLSLLVDNDWILLKKENCRAKQKQTLFVQLQEKRKELCEKNEIFLSNDTLTFQCCLVAKFSKHQSSKKCYANTVISVERHAFVVPWILPSFVTSTNSNASFQDCFFNIPIHCQTEHGKIEFRITWCLNINEKGKVLIRRVDTDDSRLFLIFKVFPVDLLERCQSLTSNEQMLLPEEEEWEIPFSVDKSVKEFIPVDEFFPVRLELTLLDGRYSTTSVKTVHDSLEVLSDPKFRSEKGYATNWKKMFDDKKFCDVILSIENTDFPAHKSVLCASSPVFTAMLENDMKEKETGVVEINDVSKETLQQLLSFIYTGTVADIQQKSAIELYAAADKYEIPDMKRVCSSFLKTKLSVENVCDVLELADLYQDQDLERKARGYIKSHARNILASDEWKTFMEKRLQLAADIMFDLCIKFCD